MKCRKCNCANFEEKFSEYSSKIKNQQIQVVISDSICMGCGNSSIEAKQIKMALSDQYRKIANLLTSDEIKKIRKKLGMSQLKFAKFLNIGEASIRRWESYFIQEKSCDDLIRLKSDLAHAELNYHTLSSKIKDCTDYSKSDNRLYMKEEEEEYKFHQWKDFEMLFKHLGASVSWSHSRLRVNLNGCNAIFYCIDKNAEIDPISLTALNKYLNNIGYKNEI